MPSSMRIFKQIVLSLHNEKFYNHCQDYKSPFNDKEYYNNIKIKKIIKCII